MQSDLVVEEVRAAREAYARRFGFDLKAICRDLREQEQAGGRELVSLPPRRPEAISPEVAEARDGLGPDTATIRGDVSKEGTRPDARQRPAT